MPTNSNINKAPSSAPPSRDGEVRSSENLQDVRAVGGAREAYQDAFALEDAQESTGRVSEILGEAASENKPAGTGSNGNGDDTSAKKSQAQIKAALLKNIPSEAVLRKQIKREIEVEIGHLHKKAMKMLRSPAKVNFFELTNVLRKIRELKGLLSTLLKASFDSLKTLWLRYVHGIM